jgi:NAD-dependent SIR2 family protein deacetylase
MEDKLKLAVAWLAEADGLLITAGAGMGIDSGLPDFRGPGGFWSVYPALGRAKIAFESIANPAAFDTDPRLAWGFYGHRLNLYRQTTPHAGFGLLRDLAGGMPQGLRAFTSNVDGHFQKAGFAPDQVCEIHGSIHHLQCAAGCEGKIWAADDFHPQIDTADCRLLNDPPHCPRCGRLA